MSQRVLLIDDSPLQLRARKAVLRDAGFDVCVATTADDALALLRSGPVADSILLSSPELHADFGI